MKRSRAKFYLLRRLGERGNDRRGKEKLGRAEEDRTMEIDRDTWEENENECVSARVYMCVHAFV